MIKRIEKITKGLAASPTFVYIAYAAIVLTGIMTSAALSDNHPTLIIAVVILVIMTLKYIERMRPRIIALSEKEGITFPDETRIPWERVRRLELIRAPDSDSLPVYVFGRRYKKNDRINLYFQDEGSDEILIREIRYSDIGVGALEFEDLIFRYYSKSLKKGGKVDFSLYGKKDLSRNFPLIKIRFILPFSVMLIGMAASFIFFYILLILWIAMGIWSAKVMSSYYISISNAGVDIAGKAQIPWSAVSRVEHKYSDYKEAFYLDEIILYYRENNEKQLRKKRLQNILFALEMPDELVNLINYYIRRNA